MKNIIIVIIGVVVLVSGYFFVHESDKRICCEALTAECLACAEGLTVEEFCSDDINRQYCELPE